MNARSNAAEHPTFTAFSEGRCLASGALRDVALAMFRAQQGAGSPPTLVLSDATGKVEDLDLRGGEGAIAERYASSAPVSRALAAKCAAPPIGAPDAENTAEAETLPPRGRGRPKLGVVAREVTLLPEHWDWLATQPGGASVALRKLVHEAKRQGAGRFRERQAQERAYHAMVALAGDLAGFEEASRALFAGDVGQLAAQMKAWPDDIRNYVLRLAQTSQD